jgi:hypothetical protein
MKKRLFLVVLTTFTTVTGQADKTAAKDIAKDVLTRASGKLSRFIYDELKQIKLTGRSSGEVAKPEVTQTRLANRLFDLELRLEKVLDRCGPGVERPKSAHRKAQKGNDTDDSPINLEGRAGGWGSHTGTNIGGFDRISGGLHSQLPPRDLSGQHGMSTQDVVDPSGSLGGIGILPQQGDFGGLGFDSMFGFPGLGGFDPLGAMGYTESYRRKRYADGERVTKAKIKKKIQRMNSSFEPMETFLDTELENCARERVSSLRAKVNKVKSRVEKVIKRQGDSILQKQRKKRV